jgi:hypothetical protein
LPKTPLIQRLANRLNGAVVSVLLDDKELDTGFIASTDDGIGIFQTKGHGLFNNDVLTKRNHIQSPCRVVTGRRADDDRIT